MQSRTNIACENLLYQQTTSIVLRDGGGTRGGIKPSTSSSHFDGNKHPR